MDVKELLERVAQGTVSVEESVLALKEAPYQDVGVAKIDTHRKLRQGAAEVIYGASKTPEQILTIVEAMITSGQKTVLITRMSKDAAELVSSKVNLYYDNLSRVGIVGDMPKKKGRGTIVVACGGTSDIPVAEEAALTAEVLGNEVIRL